MPRVCVGQRRRARPPSRRGPSAGRSVARGRGCRSRARAPDERRRDAERLERARRSPGRSGPEPTTHARVPGDPLRLAVPPASAPAAAPRFRGRSLAMARTSAATYSAIGWSKTPRALVTTVSEAASSGHIRWSTPALAVCTQRGRGPSPGQAARTASRGEVPDQQHVGVRQPLGEASPRRRADPGAAGQPAEAGRRVGVRGREGSGAGSVIRTFSAEAVSERVRTVRDVGGCER